MDEVDGVDEGGEGSKYNNWRFFIVAHPICCVFCGGWGV